MGVGLVRGSGVGEDGEEDRTDPCTRPSRDTVPTIRLLISNPIIRETRLWRNKDQVDLTFTRPIDPAPRIRHLGTHGQRLHQHCHRIFVCD